MEPTRRTLLKLATAGLLPAMTGMTSPTAAAAPLPVPPPGTGAGRKVLILGAGVAGLLSAYLLNRAGFEVRVLEAQPYAGGRNRTARRGTVITEVAPDGTRTRQTCAFDDGLYVNLGPGRIPHHHRRLLAWCADLGVEMQPYVMESAANLHQSPAGFGGSPQRRRRLEHDTRGYLAALLDIAVRAGALNGELSSARRTELLDLLRVFGGLDGVGSYEGSTRAGYALPLSIRQTAEPAAPAALTDLLASGFWRHRFHQPDDYLWQGTMFQPVGGMDRIVDAFVRRVGGLISYGHEVTGIQVAADGVDVTGTAAGSRFTARADYCLSSIPFPVLQRIHTNFSASYDRAVRHGRTAPTCKVAWQAERRFWETERQIYGGISWIDHSISQLWYPSSGFFSAKGVLVGAYNFGDNALALGRLSPRARLDAARAGGRRLHPEIGDESVVPSSKGLSIAWHRVPFQLGGWASWSDVAADREAYGRLLAPDRRFHMIGDQVSPLPAWQEGAVMSAEYVCSQLAFAEAAYTEAGVPEVHRAPDSQALAEG